MSTTNHPVPLRDVLYQFSLSKPVPDARLLDEFIAHYPEYAAEITDFAIELAVDALRGEDDEPEEASLGVSPEVSRAMSRFQNRLFTLRHGEVATPIAAPAALPTAVNPFRSLDRAAFRELARCLGANTLFVVKLRDRQIDPTTITPGFRKRVAEELDVPIDVMVAHFAAPPEGHAPQFHKAEQKPRHAAQQSFEAAVRSSGLTVEQQRHLMSL